MFSTPELDAQLPTHARLHLRDACDAHVLLEAVRLGILQQVYRRLNTPERDAYIRSGSVFVWEESEDGIRRWTEGRSWNPSRMRAPFLFYEERVADSETKKPCMRVDPTAEASRITDHNVAGTAASTGRKATTALVKQSYSAFVRDSPGRKPKKWHITAYLALDDVKHLPTIDLDPTLRTIVIPPGMYRSARSRSRQVDHQNVYGTLPDRADLAAMPVQVTPSNLRGLAFSRESPPGFQQLDAQRASIPQQQMLAHDPYNPTLAPQMSWNAQQVRAAATQHTGRQFTTSAGDRDVHARLVNDQRLISMFNARTMK